MFIFYDFFIFVVELLIIDPAAVRQVNLTRQGDLLHHSDITVPDDNLHR